MINRFYSHNRFAKKGYTIRFRSWVLVYEEFHTSKKEALSGEKQLKSARGRKFIYDEIISNIK